MKIPWHSMFISLHVHLEVNPLWSEMILNYRRMMERYPNLKEEVSNLNPGCEISSLPDEKTCQVVNYSCAWRWPIGLLSQDKKKEKKKKKERVNTLLETFY